MLVKEFSKPIFWNYNPDVDLPDRIVAEQVLQYGDLEDITYLVRNVSLNTIEDVIEKMKKQKRWGKRVFMIETLYIKK